MHTENDDHIQQLLAQHEDDILTIRTMQLVPMQPGDVPVTFADTTPLEEDFGFLPHTSLREGLRKFAEWYKEFYK